MTVTNTHLNHPDSRWLTAYKTIDIAALAVILALALRVTGAETYMLDHMMTSASIGILFAACALDVWMLHFRKKIFISIYLMPLALIGALYMSLLLLHETVVFWLLPVMICLFVRLPFHVAIIVSISSIALSMTLLTLHWHSSFDFFSQAALSAIFTLLSLCMLFKINLQTVNQLNQTSHLLNNALQTMSQGIVVIGEDGRLKLFNDKFCELLRLPKSLLEKKPLLADITKFQTERGDFGVAHSNVQEEAREYVRGFGANTTVNIPHRYLRVDPTGRHIEVKSHSMPTGDVVRTFTDVTEYESVHTQLKNAITKNQALSLNVLAQTREKMVAALTQLALIRDNETGLHIQRTQLYCRALAQALVQNDCYVEQLSDKQIDVIVMAAPMHDLGKVGIPDTVLLKPGRHTAEESTIMRTHAMLGESILRVAAEENNESDSLFVIASNIAGGHHENWDGSGYPRQLRGLDIPLEARLMALADVYDALTSERVYKASWTHEQARTEIIALSGVKFDPMIVHAFEQIDEQFRTIARELADAEVQS